MSSLFAFVLRGWGKPKHTETHLYTVVESNSEDDIEEQKSIAKVNALHFGSMSRRKKCLYVGLITALWFTTAAILSLIIPTFPRLNPETPNSSTWFPISQ